MKTTIDLPDELLREAKAIAARQGTSLREVVSTALRAHLARPARIAPGKEAWRVVLGRGDAAAVAAVDQAVDEGLEAVDPEAWL